MKRWTQIFKVFGNINRIKIVKILSQNIKLTVSQIADELDISLKATSKHLIILHNLDVLESIGRDGHVYYFINHRMPRDLKRVISLFSKHSLML